jgi:hypothetical protein
LFSEDDLAYRKSVRNMSLVLAAIVLTVFASLFVPPYLFPSHNAYPTSVTSGSPYGFTLHLALNTTSLAGGGSLLLTGWLNSTSSLVNVTVADNWALPQADLLPLCSSGWPIGIGVMQGHYTQDNYTLGSLKHLRAESLCRRQPSPNYFVTEDHSSTVLVNIIGSPTEWNLVSSFAFSSALVGPMSPGVYTAVLADEWGDVLTAIFQVK